MPTSNQIIVQSNEREIACIKRLIFFVGVVFTAFHLYATLSGVVSLMVIREVHVAFAIVLGALTAWYKSCSSNNIGIFSRILYSLIMVGVIVAAGYLVLIDDEIIFHLGDPSNFEIFLAAITLLSLLYITSKFVGNILPAIALIAVLYGICGHLLPSGLAHKGYDIGRIASNLFLSEDGIYGVPTGASATVVVMFVTFGAFLQKAGAEIVFKDGAFAIFGKVRGGPAKIAVVTSALFGTVNGSAIANVVTTGTFTIPLMKSVGYPPYFAGAVEAVASTGGQIMPPIMGTAAFIMAQVLGVPYSEIAISAIIPSLLYFYMCFLVTDLQAVKAGMKGLSSEELPSLRNVGREGWHVLLTIAILLWLLLVVKLSPNKTAMYCCFFCVVASWLSPKNKMSFKDILDTLAEAGRGMVTVALACATAGVVIGILGLTGLGLKMSSLLVEWSGGNLLILLILTMITGIVLGMGLPTTGVYIILSVLAAPALITLGVEPLSAHFFVFYYGVLATITPPVALASYAGAAIAGADNMKTSWTSVKLGAAGFLMPFIFVYGPAILMQGTPAEILRVGFTSFVGITALAFALQGFPKSLVLRGALIVSSVLLLDPGLFTDILGCALVVVVFVIDRFFLKDKVRE